MKIKGKLGKVLLPLLLVTIFVVLPFVSMGALWVQNVALLPGTAVVFPSDAAAMDRFMAAALKPYYGDRIGVCDGTNDHVEIQAALNAVRDVKLSPGQFNCEVTIDIENTNQTLRGCGRNTVLTTSTADLIFLSAVGGDSSELTGIVIADIQIDGGVGEVSDCGIYFEYVDYSFVQNVYSRRHASRTGSYLAGIVLTTSDFNTVTGNTCQGNGSFGIRLNSSSSNVVIDNTCQGNGASGIHINSSSSNVVIGNICQGNDSHGISLSSSNNNTITGNFCQGPIGSGIYLFSSNNNTITGNFCQGPIGSGIYLSSSDGNTISGNTCLDNQTDGIKLSSSDDNTISGNIIQENGDHGIGIVSSNSNTITGNSFIANSQMGDNTFDNIYLIGSDYNNIQANTCRAGGLAAVPRYGINISSDNCDGNLVTNNDIYDDGFGTGSFNDLGTGTVTVAGNRV